MATWSKLVSLSVGGALGVNARYWMNVAVGAWDGRSWPWATFLINLTGSFAIGFLGPPVARWLPAPQGALLVLTGFLGGYTTFSTFSLEVYSLSERGHADRALGYAVSSLVLGPLSVAIGLLLGRALAPLDLK